LRDTHRLLMSLAFVVLHKIPRVRDKNVPATCYRGNVPVPNGSVPVYGFGFSEGLSTSIIG